MGEHGRATNGAVPGFDELPDLEIPPAPPPPSAPGPVSTQQAAPRAPRAPSPDEALGTAPTLLLSDGGAGAAWGSGPISTTRVVARVNTPAASRGGLELSHHRLAPKNAENDDEGISLGARLGGVGLVVGSAAAGAGPLLRFAHAPGGRSLLRAVPAAFDGSSAPESGVVALAALVLAVATGTFGLKIHPRSWAITTAAGAILLTALAMVTVTLASTGDTPTPPDGALVVPYLVPFAMATFALGLMARAHHRWLYARRRFAAIPVALVAGVLLFAAFETSPLATLLR